MKTEIEIKHQGAILVNSAEIAFKNESVALITIDCESKYFDYSGTSSSDKEFAIYLYAANSSIYLKDGVDRDEPTRVSLPDFGEWRLFSCSCFRFTCYLTLIKNIETE